MCAIWLFAKVDTATAAKQCEYDLGVLYTYFEYVLMRVITAGFAVFVCR